MPRFGEQRDGLKTELIAVGLDGAPVPGVKIDVTLMQIQWTSVRRAESNGFYGWETQRTEVPSGEWHLTSALGPVPLAADCVDCLSTAVDAHPGNGRFHPSPDFTANGAGPDSRVLRRKVQANRLRKKSCAWTNGGNETGDWRLVPTRERRRAGLRTCNGRRPPITAILGMALSTYRRTSQQMAPTPIPGSCAVKFRQIVRVRRVAPAPIGGNNARERRVVPNSSGRRLGGRPAIGAFHPYEVELNR